MTSFYKNLKVGKSKEEVLRSDLKVTDVKDSLNEILEIIESENHQGFLMAGTLLGFLEMEIFLNTIKMQILDFL